MKDPSYLYRSKRNRIVGGVWGGVGKYIGVDPVILRIGYITLSTFTGLIPGAIAYLAIIFIVPEEPEVQHNVPKHFDALDHALFDQPTTHPPST